jgi:hypothetical protein
LLLIFVVRGGFSHERKIIDFIIIITDVFLSLMSVISLMTRMSVTTLGLVMPMTLLVTYVGGVCDIFSFLDESESDVSDVRLADVFQQLKLFASSS